MSTTSNFLIFPHINIIASYGRVKTMTLPQCDQISSQKFAKNVVITEKAHMFIHVCFMIFVFLCFRLFLYWILCYVKHWLLIIHCPNLCFVSLATSVCLLHTGFHFNNPFLRVWWPISLLSIPSIQLSFLYPFLCLSSVPSLWQI